jgi:hypothetical protein
MNAAQADEILRLREYVTFVTSYDAVTKVYTVKEKIVKSK